MSSIAPALVKQLTIRTGVGIYDQLRQIYPKLYPNNIPKEGLDLTVNYVDTGVENQKFTQTLVAIHGCPGYFNHFSNLIDHYRDSNVRVIVPNLPDFSHTRSSGGIFWHTTLEKLKFVQDFLRQIEVDRIDCLVAHSLGFQTVAALCEKPESVKINSVALMSPTPLWGNSHELKTTMNRLMLLLLYFRKEWSYKLMEALRIHRSFIWPVKFANINEFLIFSAILFDHQTPIDVIRRLEHLVNQTRTPITLMYGSADPVINHYSSSQMYHRLGIIPEDIVHIDPNVDSLESKIVNTNKRINGYMIKDAGHFAHAKYYKHANRMVDNLLLNIKQTNTV